MRQPGIEDAIKPISPKGKSARGRAKRVEGIGADVAGLAGPAAISGDVPDLVFGSVFLRVLAVWT